MKGALLRDELQKLALVGLLDEDCKVARTRDMKGQAESGMVFPWTLQDRCKGLGSFGIRRLANFGFLWFV